MGHQSTEATRTSISEEELARRQELLDYREARLALREAELSGQHRYSEVQGCLRPAPDAGPNDWYVVGDDFERLQESKRAAARDERRVQARRAESYDIAHGAGLAMSAEYHVIELVRIIQLSEDIQANTVIADTWIIALINFHHMASLRDAIENWVTPATMWSTILSPM